MQRLTSDTGASAVTHDGETHTPLDGTDAVFDLPDEVAAHLLGMAGWRATTDDDLPDDDLPDDDLPDDDLPDDAAAPQPRRGRRRPA